VGVATLLEVRNLQTQFTSAHAVVRAVNGVSFSLDEGETLGIVGESGCGKSVTALSLMRLIPSPPGKIVGGEAVFEGRDLLQLPDEEMRRIRGQKIAMVFQDPMTSLNPVLSINQQISEALMIHLDLDRTAARKRTIELLDLVGIPDAHRRVDDYPHQFSGGMRQRVMIAMALSCNPRLLIADEPTTALDVTIQAQIVDLVLRLQAEFHMAIIWITHDLGVVARLANRVVVMYAGRIVEEATVDEVFDTPRHPYTLGLLGSIPRLDEVRQGRLQPIEGMPPDLSALSNSCAFEPRCRFATPRCREEGPELTLVDAPSGATATWPHRTRCWNWQDLRASSEVTV
jgi:oligopeptide transport system ATP-binding protein